MDDMRTRFLLGSHQPGWLTTAGVPLFISDRRLRVFKTLPRAAAPWALDSGGFTELQQFGAWTVSAQDYVARVRRYRDQIGALLWAAPQDWMCEPAIVVKTGLSVAEHQARTVENFCTLRQLAPELPIIPVVQGWTVTDLDALAAMNIPEGETCVEIPDRLVPFFQQAR